LGFVYYAAASYIKAKIKYLTTESRNCRVNFQHIAFYISTRAVVHNTAWHIRTP